MEPTPSYDDILRALPPPPTYTCICEKQFKNRIWFAKHMSRCIAEKKMRLYHHTVFMKLIDEVKKM